MVKKRQVIKRAIRDRRRIKQAAQRAALPKIKNLLTEAVLNEDEGQMTPEQVRRILGVEIPQQDNGERQPRQQSNVESSPLTRDQIAKQNNRRVDSNMAQVPGKQGQTSAGVVRIDAREKPAVSSADVPVPPRPPAPPQSEVLPATPEGISDNKERMSDRVSDVGGVPRTQAQRKGQVERKLADARSQTVPTSVEQNIAQRQKEMQDMDGKIGRDEQWIKESLQVLQSTDIYKSVGLQQQRGRPGLDVIEETFSNDHEIPVQGDERSDKISMPTARDQDIRQFLVARVDDKRSNSRRKMAQLSRQDREREKGYNKDVQLEGTQQDSTERPKQKQVITEGDQRQILGEVQKLRNVGKKLVNENARYKMFVKFVLQNFQRLNPSRVNKLHEAMIKIRDVKKLEQRYGKRGKILRESVTAPRPKKKIFQSNSGKFNKLRTSILNNKAAAQTAQSHDPQRDRMRQLAGL